MMTQTFFRLFLQLLSRVAACVMTSQGALKLPSRTPPTSHYGQQSIVKYSSRFCDVTNLWSDVTSYLCRNCCASFRCVCSAARMSCMSERNSAVSVERLTSRTGSNSTPSSEDAWMTSARRGTYVTLTGRAGVEIDGLVWVG